MRKNKKIEDVFEVAKKIALRYGFETISDFAGTTRKKRSLKTIKQYGDLEPTEALKNDISYILKTYIGKGFHKEQTPAFIFHSNLDKDSSPHMGKYKKTDKGRVCLSIIGLDGPFAEAKAISCTNNILSKLFGTDILVKFNSMIDKPSMTKYIKDMTAAIYKNIDFSSEKCMKLLKGSFFPSCACKITNCLKAISAERYSSQPQKRLLFF